MIQVRLADRILSFPPELRLQVANRLVRGSRWMPHSIAVEFGLTRPTSLALITVLHIGRSCTAQLLLYHACEPSLPVGAVPFGEGFPPLPWRCPLCEEFVLTYEELQFDLEIIMIDDVEIL